MPSVRQKKYNEKSLFSHLSFGAHTQVIQSSNLEPGAKQQQSEPPWSNWKVTSQSKRWQMKLDSESSNSSAELLIWNSLRLKLGWILL